MKNQAFRDRYGFWFWLQWILYFAGSFVLAALFWTKAMQVIFGKIEGAELTITWVVSVFGSWLILVIPFMRKKEQIWKRLNDDQEKAVDAWLAGMMVFIGLLAVSAFFWSLKLKGSAWFKAVFGSWLVVLLPFLTLMYRKADLIFKNAMLHQTHEARFKSVWIEASKRQLPDEIARKIKALKPTLRGGHLVTLILENGRRIEDVFVLSGTEIAGIYRKETLDFDLASVRGVEETLLGKIQNYEESHWTRFNVLQNYIDDKTKAER